MVRLRIGFEGIDRDEPIWALLVLSPLWGYLVFGGLLFGGKEKTKIYLVKRLKRFNLVVMILCRQCGAIISQTEGKRQKEFCDNTCRSNFWYGKNKKGKVVVKNLTKPTTGANQKIEKKPTQNESLNTMPKGLTLMEQLEWREKHPK